MAVAGIPRESGVAVEQTHKHVCVYHFEPSHRKVATYRLQVSRERCNREDIIITIKTALTCFYCLYYRDVQRHLMPARARMLSAHRLAPRNRRCRIKAGLVEYTLLWKCFDRAFVKTCRMVNAWWPHKLIHMITNTVYFSKHCSLHVSIGSVLDLGIDEFSISSLLHLNGAGSNVMSPAHIARACNNGCVHSEIVKKQIRSFRTSNDTIRCYWFIWIVRIHLDSC